MSWFANKLPTAVAAWARRLELADAVESLGAGVTTVADAVLNGGSASEGVVAGESGLPYPDSARAAASEARPIAAETKKLWEARKNAIPRPEPKAM